MKQGSEGADTAVVAPSLRWSRVKWCLRLTLSAALLSLVLLRVDASQLRLLTGATHWGWWSAGLALMLLAHLASAQRFRFLLGSLGHPVRFGSIVAINLEAMFASLVLPGELVAGLVRWDRVSGHTGDRSSAFGLVVGERLIDWTVLALVAAAGSPLLFAGESAPTLRAVTLAIGATVAIGSLSALSAARSRFLAGALESWQARSRPVSGSWAGRTARALAASRALTANRRSSAIVLLWTALYWGTATCGATIMARALYEELPVLPIVAANAVIALLAHLPFTVAGVGLRELSLPVLLGAYGVTSEWGLVLGLSSFVPYVLLGLAGFVVFLIGRPRSAGASRAGAQPFEGPQPPQTGRSRERHGQPGHHPS